MSKDDFVLDVGFSYESSCRLTTEYWQKPMRSLRGSARLAEPGCQRLGQLNLRQVRGGASEGGGEARGSMTLVRVRLTISVRFSICHCLTLRLRPSERLQFRL